ncbi:MAG: DUF3828 domain-containing protein [Gemmatimonadaceae bacterium]
MSLWVFLAILGPAAAPLTGDAFERSMPAATTDASPVQASPRATVQALYADHFKHDMGFSTKSVARKRRWLSPSLSAAIAAYFKRPTPADEVPPIDGDPFTDAQDYPTKYTIGAVTAAGSKATVEVVMHFDAEQRTVRVQLVHGAAGWLVDDLSYPEGNTFRQLLQQKE